jgi:PhnO protein
MNKKITIRKTELKDLHAIYDFTCKLEDQRLDFEVFKAIFSDNIGNPLYAYYIAEVDGTAGGFISFHTQQLLHHCGPVGEIQEFYVLGEHRGQGIGRILIAEIGKYARANGLEGIEVTSNKKREVNVMVYKQLGFDLSHNKFTIPKEQFNRI